MPSFPTLLDYHAEDVVLVKIVLWETAGKGIGQGQLRIDSGITHKWRLSLAIVWRCSSTGTLDFMVNQYSISHQLVVVRLYPTVVHIQNRRLHSLRYLGVLCMDFWDQGCCCKNLSEATTPLGQRVTQGRRVHAGTVRR